MNAQTIWQYLFRTPHRLAYADAGGVRTRFVEAGTPGAHALILLHGTAGSLENFCANIEALSEHFHVFAIDMLGCGLTGKPDFDYRIQDYAKHVLDFMASQNIGHASFMGVSLGSWVAAHLAQQWPERVNRLVMVAPAGILADLEEERRVAENVRKTRLTASTNPTWENVRAALAKLVLDPQTLIDDLIAIRLFIYQQPDMKRAMPRLLAFIETKEHLSHDNWRRLAAPVLVVAAVDSENMFLTNARAIAGLAPWAQVLELHGCDHWAQFEQPDALHKACISFLTASRPA